MASANRSAKRSDAQKRTTAKAWRVARAAVEAAVAAFGAAYVGEMERLAEELEPEFREGKLHAYREKDDRRALARGERCPDPVLEVLSPIVAEHLGFRELQAAHLLALVSPQAGVVGVGDAGGLVELRDAAAEAVAWDVIAIARERGWYTPTSDEAEDPLLRDAQAHARAVRAAPDA